MPGKRFSCWWHAVREQRAINELTAITGQKAVATLSRKDISNFKLRKKMPIGVMVTLRRDKMYEFLERLVRVALPRIRDFKGIESKLDGRGNVVQAHFRCVLGQQLQCLEALVVASSLEGSFFGGILLNQFLAQPNESNVIKYCSDITESI